MKTTHEQKRLLVLGSASATTANNMLPNLNNIYTLNSFQGLHPVSNPFILLATSTAP